MFRPGIFFFLFFSTQILGAISALTWKTFDISSLLVEESKKVTYRDINGNNKGLETIVRENGANNVKIRLWVNPADGIYNTAYGVKVGLRAKAAGLSVSLNLHYSDTWADPGHQTTPAAWKNMNIDQLVAAVKSYTTTVVNAFVDQGIDVNLVSVGNEIRAGLLWPLGSNSNNFGNVARILTAGIAGVRASKKSTTAIMVHLDEGYSWGSQKWFYDSLVATGSFSMSSFDVQGVSYYPYWSTSSTLANFQTSVNNMANTYKKKIIVMETDWPVKCTSTSNIPSSLRSIPFSAAGQVTWMKSVASIVNAIPNGLGVGIMYWEPGWIDNASLGSSCEDSTLFDGDWSGYPTTVIARARTFRSINMFNQI